MMGKVGKRGDDAPGNLLVLEAVLIAIIMVGSVVFVMSFRAPQTEGASTREFLELEVRDGLTVLLGMESPQEEYNNRLLNKAVVEALHGDSGELRRRFDKFLPAGTVYNVYLDNGYALTELTTPYNPPGESVTGEITFSPSWSYLFLVPDFLNYSSATNVNMTLTGLPIYKGRILEDSGVTQVWTNFSNDYEVDLKPGFDPPFSRGNESFTNDVGQSGFPTTGEKVVWANWEYKGNPLNGTAEYGVSAASVVYDTHWAARDGLNTSTLDIDGGRNKSLTDIVTVTYDVTDAWTAVSGSTLGGTTYDVTVRIYAPVQGLAETPTQWLEVKKETKGALTGSVEYKVPRDAPYGTYAVVASLNYTLDASGAGSNQSARLVEYFNVGLLDGTQQPDPLYRVVVVAWFDDWY